MPRTRTGRALGDIARALARGELTAAQAAALTARLRDQQQQAMYRAALDAAAGPAHPVQVRLIGPRADVAAVLTALDTVTVLTDVSDPTPARRAGGAVLVYATALRHRPMTGGPR